MRETNPFPAALLWAGPRVTAAIHMTMQCPVLPVPIPSRSRLSLAFLINPEAVWGDVGLSEPLGKQTEATSGAALEFRDLGCFCYFKA